MSIADNTKLDKAFKFINGKGYTTTQKSLDNEDAAGGFLIDINSVFSVGIPGTAPGASTATLTYYGATSRFAMVADISSPLNRAWYASTDGSTLQNMRVTRVPNWIPTTFGDYTIRMFLTHGASTFNPAVQEIFFSDQTAPLFDYKTGILTFETDPLATYASLSPTPDGIQISGYVYIGNMLNDVFDGYGRIKIPLTDNLTEPGTGLAIFTAADGLTISSPTGASGTLLVNAPDSDGYALGVTGKGAGSGIYSVGGETNAYGLIGIGGITNGSGGGFQGTGTGSGVLSFGGANNGFGVYGIGTAGGYGVVGQGGATAGVGVYGQGTAGGQGVLGVGGTDADGVFGQGTGVGTGVTGYGGVTGGAGVVGNGTGTGYGAILQAGPTGGAVRLNSTTGRALEIFHTANTTRASMVVLDSANNRRVLYDRVGYRMGRSVSYDIKWSIEGGGSSLIVPSERGWIVALSDADMTASYIEPTSTYPAGMISLNAVSATDTNDYAFASSVSPICHAGFTGLVFAMEWEASCSAVSTSDRDNNLAMGLMDSTYLAGFTQDILTGTPKFIGFGIPDNNTANGWTCYTKNGSGGSITSTVPGSQSGGGVGFAANDILKFRIEIWGSGTPIGATTVYFFIDSAAATTQTLRATHTTNIPSAAMYAIFLNQVITGGATQDVAIGPVRIEWNRYLTAPAV